MSEKKCTITPLIVIQAFSIQHGITKSSCWTAKQLYHFTCRNGNNPPPKCFVFIQTFQLLIIHWTFWRLWIRWSIYRSRYNSWPNLYSACYRFLNSISNISEASTYVTHRQNIIWKLEFKFIWTIDRFSNGKICQIRWWFFLISTVLLITVSFSESKHTFFFS